MPTKSTAPLRLETEIWVAQFATVLARDQPAVSIELGREIGLSVHDYLGYLPPKISVATLLDTLKAAKDGTLWPIRDAGELGSAPASE